MTQTQIDYFLKTYETGNIALAADELFVSRSAVSRAISDLEKEFQTELFIRTKSGVLPSKAGKMVYEVLCNISGSYAKLNEKIKELNTDKSCKKIRLGLTPTNSARTYHQFVKSFFDFYPDVELTIVEEARQKCREMLSQGDIDVAILPVGTRPDYDKEIFNNIPLYKNKIVFWTSSKSEYAKKKDLDIFDILDAPLGYLRVPMPLEDTLNSCFAAYGKETNVVVRTSSVGMLSEMVADGRVCAIVPNDMLPETEDVIPVNLHFFKDCENSILWNALIPCSEIVQKFIDHVASLKDNSSI